MERRQHAPNPRLEPTRDTLVGSLALGDRWGTRGSGVTLAMKKGMNKFANILLAVAVLHVVACSSVRKVDHNHVRIRGDLYELRRVVEPFDFETTIVEHVEVRNSTLGSVVSQALNDCGLHENLVAIFPGERSDNLVTVNLRRVELGLLLHYLSEIVDLEIVRQNSHPPIILRCRSIPAEQTTRAMTLYGDIMNAMVDALEWITANSREQIIYEVQEDRNTLIIHGRREVLQRITRH